MDEKEWRDHRYEFVQHVKSPALDNLLDDLQHAGVFTTAEVEFIKSKQAREQARALIDSVINKGKEAKGILLSCIRNREPLLAKQMKILTQQGPEALSQQQEPRAQIPVQETSPPEPAHSEEWLTPCAKEFVQKIQREQEAQIYNILDKQSRTRLALIINNEKFDSLSERTGSEHDETQMECLLKGLGYKVEIKRNLTSKEMETSLTDFSKRSEHDKSDSTFIVIMSHGLRDRICGRAFHKKNPDNPDVLQFDTIFKTFNNKNCKALRNKPKVLIIQACRGENKASVLVSDSIHKADDACPVPSDMDLEDDGLKKVLIESDFFCLCSSTPGPTGS
ncbi:caspase-1-like isoform X2 [Lissotriton helveticus]